MKSGAGTKVGLMCLLAACALAAPGVLRAQETPGPLPAPAPQLEPLEPAASRSPEVSASSKPIPPRTSIAGAWKLNTDESDDGRKKVQQAQSKNQGNGGGNGGNPRMGGGGNPYPGQGGGNPYPGQGGGGNGGGGRRGGPNQPSDMDPGTMRDLTDPPETLSIVQKDTKGVEVDLTDDRTRKFALFTDGRMGSSFTKRCGWMRLRTEGQSRDRRSISSMYMTQSRRRRSDPGREFRRIWRVGLRRIAHAGRRECSRSQK
jgi:hypothetical protein